MDCAAEVRDFSQIIDWKTGVDSGNITPAKRLETLTGLAGNFDRREQISHDGTKHGLLYRVIVTDPKADLIQHSDSKGAPGEEMLTTRNLHLEFLEEVPLKEVYEYSEEL